MVAGISGSGRDEMARLFGRGRRLVTVGVAAEILAVSRVEAAKKLARWATMGWLRRVRRGLYVPVPLEAESPEAWSEDALYVADAVWAPCYFTGWTAANHWGLTEQLFRTTVLKTSQRVRASRQCLLDHEYLVSHVSESQIWATVVAWRHDRRLRMADPTRTVVDILDRPALAGGIRHASEIVAAYLEEHEGRDFVVYGDRLGNAAVFKRLGYLLDVLGMQRPELIAECRKRVSAGISLLAPEGPSVGPIARVWGIRANAAIARPGVS